jgi:hypothetical protein
VNSTNDSEGLLKLVAILAGVVIVVGLSMAAFNENRRARVATVTATTANREAAMGPASSNHPLLTAVDGFIQAHGRPDVDDTTALDNPRPPIVTRWLIYKRQRVRVTYIQLGHVGDPPPYEWKFLAFQDAVTDAVIDRSEALRRMAE